MAKPKYFLLKSISIHSIISININISNSKAVFIKSLKKYYIYKYKYNQMCGIIAFLSKNIDAYQYLINGLIILQNRGYDSAGICTINSNNVLINTKFASSDESAIDILKKDDIKKIHNGNKIGIAHTRWATHGGKTDYNAHPHIDSKNRVAVVHNGIIENYRELKKKLLDNGFTFSSDTDTEIIANLISYYIDKLDKSELNGNALNGNEVDILDAIHLAINDLHGTWGLAILYNNHPDHIYVCKKGSPLLIAYDNDFTIVASEASAFSQYTNKYIVLHDNEIIKLGTDNNTKLMDYEVKTIETNDEIKLVSDPYPHWMLKEIFEQPESSLKAINMGGRIKDEHTVKLGGLFNHRDALLNIKNLLIIASGTSYHAGLLGAKYFRLLKCFNTVSVIDASEFTIDDIPEKNVGMLVLSQSGETKDVHRVIEVAKSYNIIIIGIVNVVDSLIARDSTCGVYLNAGREVSVASTKSFTSQVIVIALVAIWFSQNKNDSDENNTDIFKYKRTQIINDMRNISTNFIDIIRNIPVSISDDFIKRISKKEHLFILGRGYSYPIAIEGALKIKEVSYIHAEGYAGGALKHGPFALIENGMPILLIILNDENADKMNICLEEVKSRGAYTIVITNIKKYKKNNLCDYCIMIPDCGIFSSLLAIMPIQYMAYKLALELGYNPDFPKNLAKCVVVD